MNEPNFIEILPKEASDVKQVLDSAYKADLAYSLVIGKSNDGQWFFAASSDDITKAIYCADQFKHFIMSS